MNNITFTQEQKEQIAQHIEEIKTFILENIVSNLKGNIRIDFGGEYRDPESGQTTAAYSLIIYKDTQPICSGWNAETDGNVCMCGGFGRYIEISSSHIDRKYALLKNWQYVKARIFEAMANQKTEDAFISNFKI